MDSANLTTMTGWAGQTIQNGLDRPDNTNRSSRPDDLDGSSGPDDPNGSGGPNDQNGSGEPCDDKCFSNYLIIIIIIIIFHNILIKFKGKIVLKIFIK